MHWEGICGIVSNAWSRSHFAQMQQRWETDSFLEHLLRTEKTQGDPIFIN